MSDLSKSRSIRRAVLIFIVTFTSIVLVGLVVLALARHMSGRSGILRSGEDRAQKEQSAEESSTDGDVDPVPGAETLRGVSGTTNGAEKSFGEEAIANEVKSAAKGAAGSDGKKASDGETDDPGAEETLGGEEPEEAPEPSADEQEDRYTRRAETAEPDTVRIGFAGDILFDRSYAIQAQMESRGGGIEGAVGASLLKEMRGVDIMVANNEFPYTDGGAPQEGKAFTFHAAVKNVKQM